MEARLLRAQIIRDTVSVAASLSALEEILPRMGPERPSMAPLRRQAGRLRMQNLLDLGQFDQAMELALAGMEASSRRGNRQEQIWCREMAAVTAFTMGDYRRAIQMYVILRSGGVLENEVVDQRNGKILQRYWITL